MQPTLFTEYTDYQIDRQNYILDRVVTVARVDGFDPCWEWELKLDKAGYGHAKYAGKSDRAHRASYRAFVGPIPPKLDLDHLCNNRSCTNPEHLEPVTRSENALRAVARDKANATGHWDRLDVCSKGLHAMTDDNIYIGHKRGGITRTCAECFRTRLRAYRAANPERFAAYEANRRAKTLAKREAA